MLLNFLLSSTAPQFSHRRSHDSTTGFYSQQSLHSSGFYVAAAAVIAGTPFAFRFFLVFPRFLIVILLRLNITFGVYKHYPKMMLLNTL
ncbi:hypothetical protein ES319_A13G022300v1 [Gossypium barbadense]|uniref:Uncharacterized protein n=2 Tax=Gossypium TaxID=3633 RepID=A0A5J5SZV5_GOSBA|nr:hypothetical protein ES319_A13G022300v1 [Gossypium barbadense]TYH90026.1 hypothetical protein ES332_A13G023200v1 [Gossypium tomentosum]